MTPLTHPRPRRVRFAEGDWRNVLVASYLHYDGDFLALHLNDRDEVIDVIYGWETAETIATSGGKVRVIWSDSEVFDAERVQSMCDAALAAFNDCFGEGGVDEPA